MNIFWMILDIYVVFIVLSFSIAVILKNKKIFLYFFFCAIVFAIGIAVKHAPGMKISKWIFVEEDGLNLRFYLPFLFIVLIGKEFAKELDNLRPQEISQAKVVASSQTSRDAIANACFYLAERKIGAIITMENHNSLDQYAEKAININSDISSEILINIFEPNTPLHDGAVIIRGDKIRCAGAYFVLTQAEASDKTMGSRHRAALGISEVSDALTIVCSEETGMISITNQGIMLHISSKEKLLEYIDLYTR